MAKRNVPIWLVRPGMVTAEPVIDRRLGVLAEEGVTLTEDVIDRARTAGVETIGIVDEDFVPLNKHIELKIDDPSTIKKQTEAIDKTERLFTDVRKKKQLDFDNAKTTAVSILDEALHNPQAFANLRNLKLKDEYTYQHSVDVAGLCVLIGRELNLSRVNMETLVVAALLHDVGKMLIPESVLNKPARLETNEETIMRKHSLYGYQILKRENVGERIANIVLEHHEAMDGSGYPFAKKGEALDEFSRIVAVCDVYSALTTDRVYRKAMAPYKAIKIVAAEANAHLDPEYAKIFQRVIGVYPNATYVLMSDGATGRVVEQNPNLPMRPIIQVIADKDNKRVDDIETIDLAERKDIFIKHIVRE